MSTAWHGLACHGMSSTHEHISASLLPSPPAHSIRLAGAPCHQVPCMPSIVGSDGGLVLDRVLGSVSGPAAPAPCSPSVPSRHLQSA